MKSVSVLFFVLLVTFGSDGANAYTNGDLYKICGKAASANYDFSTVPQDDKLDYTVCYAYMAAAVDATSTACHILGTGILSDLVTSSATRANLDAVIQSFLNWAKKFPDQWNDTPIPGLWISYTFPCKD